MPVPLADIFTGLSVLARSFTRVPPKVSCVPLEASFIESAIPITQLPRETSDNSPWVYHDPRGAKTSVFLSHQATSMLYYKTRMVTRKNAKAGVSFQVGNTDLRSLLGFPHLKEFFDEKHTGESPCH